MAEYAIGMAVTLTGLILAICVFGGMFGLVNPSIALIVGFYDAICFAMCVGIAIHHEKAVAKFKK